LEKCLWSVCLGLAVLSCGCPEEGATYDEPDAASEPDGALGEPDAALAPDAARDPGDGPLSDDASVPPHDGDGGVGADASWVDKLPSLRGHVLDTVGAPIPHAVIYNAVPHKGEYPSRTYTDAQGNYLLTGLFTRYPYKAYAWVELPYRDKTFCLRVAAEPGNQDGYFIPGDDPVRNFQWRLTGRMEDSVADADSDGAWYGGSIRLWVYFDPSVSSIVEVTLVPTAPLIDGTAGTTITRTVDVSQTLFVLDVPVGVYRLSAQRVYADGTRKALAVGASSTRVGADMEVAWSPPSTTLPCGAAATSSGVERTFAYLVDSDA